MAALEERQHDEADPDCQHRCAGQVDPPRLPALNLLVVPAEQPRGEEGRPAG